jgi:lysophospholipase L1-like esterase
MQSVLIYGDSQTWGAVPRGGPPGQAERHAWADRWPNVLAKVLGGDFDVISDALCGRTTAYDDHLSAENRNGAATLPNVLGTHAPVDLVIIMLGVNDLKRAQAGTARRSSRAGAAPVPGGPNRTPRRPRPDRLTAVARHNIF